MNHYTEDEQLDLLSYRDPPISIFKEMDILRKRWVKVLGYEPWDRAMYEVPSHIHRQGWCLDGFSANTNSVTYVDGLAIGVGTTRKITRGVYWLRHKVGVNIFSSAESAIEFVRDRHLSTRSAVYGLPLEIHELNKMLIMADKVTF